MQLCLFAATLHAEKHLPHWQIFSQELKRQRKAGIVKQKILFLFNNMRGLMDYKTRQTKGIGAIKKASSLKEAP
ncbi:MAG: hypothetical protein A2079_03495 [Geobacteraceae bacterium GWC2_48_7]|nr:MAG: hypothetical protein A2079_03495 [Geobacteraceae bacterium GWC2_48_7]